MRKVIFLDRDGIINRERGEYTFRQKDFVFNDDLFDFLLDFKKLEYQFVIITNQGGIAKGLYDISEFRSLTRWMESEFEANGVPILKTYFSPDHDDYSRSLSRKPASMLFERAIDQFDIDVASSIMIGDSQRDIDAAMKVGVRGILIEANSSLYNIKNLILENGE